MATMLTPHFSLEELVITQVRGVDNSPGPGIVGHLGQVAAALEEVRRILGNAKIIVSSGYRSPAVNAAVGGTKDSAHMDGYAADFICPAFGTPLEICRAIQASEMRWDQVIEEGTWVHLSVAPAMREQVLTKDHSSPSGYSVGLKKTV